RSDVARRAGRPARARAAAGHERHRRLTDGGRAPCPECRRLHRLRPATLGAARRRAAPGGHGAGHSPRAGVGRGRPAARRMRPVALVDARNVLRSRWPNIREDALVRGVEDWATGVGVDPVIVFDGRAPEVETGARLVGTGRQIADDWIADEAARLEAEGAPYWLGTSDRELLERAGRAAERGLGGRRAAPAPAWAQQPRPRGGRRAGGGAAAAAAFLARSFFLRWRSAFQRRIGLSPRPTTTPPDRPTSRPAGAQGCAAPCSRPRVPPRRSCGSSARSTRTAAPASSR